jgi:hypothetical protein
MKTTILVNSLSELVSVYTYFGIEFNVAQMVISFPYPIEIDHEILGGENEELSFEQFKNKYL